MWLFGESINVMSMGGLAVAIGLVIDDAVVVVENIHRRVKEGGSRESIEEATKELVAPVVGSTLTTVVVFAPLGLLSGVVGQFFKALSLTLSVAVLISLVLALFLIPLLARFTLRGDRRGAAPEHERRDTALQRGYLRTLPTFLHHPIARPAGAGGPRRGPASSPTSRSAAGSCRRPTRADSSSTTSRRPAWRSRTPTSGCARSRHPRRHAGDRDASSAAPDRRWACSRRR